MIRAIILDCYGVLSTDGWMPFKKEHFGTSPQLEAEASDLNKQANAGLLSMHDFVQSVAGLAHMPEASVHHALHRNAANIELLDYIRTDIKPRYKVGLLSNAGSDMLPQLFTQEQRNLFDAVALSYQTGFVKPSSNAYHELAERLQVPAEACVFVDDQERHCTGARQAGMQAIVYQDFEPFKTKLADILAG